MSSRRKLILLIWLLPIMMGAFFFRTYFAQRIMPPPARMQGETTQAYRYTKMLAEGNPIPEVDRMVMYPSGMITSQNSIFEEYIAAFLYRIVGGDFDSFMVFFSRFFPLLILPGIALWMLSAGYRFRVVLIAAIIAAVLLPGLLRTRGESLYRETIAIPLIVFLLWMTEESLRNHKKIIFHIIAGVLLFCSLACWKVTQYFSALLLIFLLWKNTGKKRITGRGILIFLSISQISASLLIPHMRYDQAVFSPATVFAVFLLISTLFHKRFLFPISLLCAIAVVILDPGSTGHVSAVILAKIRFLFSHPANPLLLSPDARLFWIEGYTSPSFLMIVLLFGIPGIIALFGMKKTVNTSRDGLILPFLIISTAGFIFFERLHVLLVIAIVPLLAATAGKWKKAGILVPILLASHSLMVKQISITLQDIGLHERNAASLLTDRELDGLFNWFKENTESDDVVLCYWHISGLISAYIPRPVITHTFFENVQNRRTIQEFARMMFLPEDSLADFCRRNSADYLIYQADMLLDRSASGLLYLAGRTGVSDDAVSLRMHYVPQALDSFQLAFQGPSLRVYAIGNTEKEFPETGPDHVLFRPELRNLFPEYGEGLSAVVNNPMDTAIGMAMDGRAGRNPLLLSASLTLLATNDGCSDDCIAVLQEITSLYLEGQYEMEGLEYDFRTYLSVFGPDPFLRRDLACLFVLEGEIEKAIEEYETVLRETPDYSDARREMEALIQNQPD